MNNKILFSVYQYDESNEVNINNTKTVEGLFKLSNIPFKLVLGVYKGISEETFMIDLKWQNEAFRVASLYNQESILIVQDMIGKLHFLKGEVTGTLGYLREITMDQAKDLDHTHIDGLCYTFIQDERANERISFDTKTFNIN